MKRLARGRGPLDEAHHTEQRGAQKSPDAEIHYMCRRHDAAELACVHTATPVQPPGFQSPDRVVSKAKGVLIAMSMLSLLWRNEKAHA